MSSITTHVLDTSRGRPAAGVPVTLEARDPEGAWQELGRGFTDADGRLKDLLPPGHRLSKGVHRLTFDTAVYFAAQGTKGFYTEIVISFVVSEAGAHYHVPLLLSPYGYTTYRGS
jgi:5-hydroxyisourate hydrolase